MRFLHTADWHVGKELNGYDLTADHQVAFEQIKSLAQTEHVDAIVVAGDLYDRRFPREAAVATVNQELKELNLELGYPVLAVSGNHDSAIRLGTGSDWYQAMNFYLHTELAQAFEPVIVGDTQWFLLPYFELQAVRNYFHDDTIQSLPVAMEKIVAEMQAKFEPQYHQVLVAHFFAAGSSRTESETKVEVGGLNAVPTDLLAEFDYVALGHLHNPNALQLPRIKYSGSPLKMSTSEATIEKGVWIVDTKTQQVTWHALQPKHDLRLVTGAFDELVAGNETGNHDDYVAINLTDEQAIPDVMSRLRVVYPRILSLHRLHGAQIKSLATTKQVNVKQAPLALLADFYQLVTDGQQLNPAQQQWAKTSLEQVLKGDD